MTLQTCPAVAPTGACHFAAQQPSEASSNEPETHLIDETSEARSVPRELRAKEEYMSRKSAQHFLASRARSAHRKIGRATLSPHAPRTKHLNLRMF